MKAWLIRVKDECCSTVVFAETRGKARSIAMATDTCEGVDFCDIEVRRLPHIDKYYKKGKREMDWYDAKDRVVLVKECNFSCDPDYVDLDECENCPAKAYCGGYECQKDIYADIAEYMEENK